MDPAFEDLHKLYQKNLRGKDRDSCQLHPAHAFRGDEAAWSTQDVIEHLVLTYRSTGALFDRYLARNSPTGSTRKWKHRALQFLVIRCGGFPRGVQAPEHARPGKADMPPMSGEELAACMRSELEKLDAKIGECQQAFEKRAFASHFIFGPLTADQWRRFHFVHGKHHLAQLKRIRKQTRAA
ncbi:MAG TPA: DUF1569 domain-containing protein [Silvibacterium sp.]|jgi:hypothetical protein|nr:DUF1569 domain-containing protein [Silvibacterium sp.]